MSMGVRIKHDLYRKRREALNPFFMKQLCRLMEEHFKQQTPVNLSDVYFAFANEYVEVLSIWCPHELM